MRFEDFSGLKFNSLTAIRRIIVEGSKKTYWLCACDCGAETRVCADSLKNSRIKSCGCMKGQAISAQRTTHGASGTPTYKSWNAMMRRCYNPKDIAFAYYGGAGITVDARWHTYENFLADMGIRPPGKTVDRIRSSEGYGPGNCRWATMEQQNRNKPGVRPLSAFGRERFMWEWAEEAGITANALRARLRSGKTLEQALQMKAA